MANKAARLTGGLGCRAESIRERRFGRCALLILATLLSAACAHAPPRFDPGARRTCLVLSAGGTRGAAQLGALKAINDAHVPISCVVGTSVGALIGGMYAAAPERDTTQWFRRLAHRYLDETAEEAQTRGAEAGLLFAALAAAISGGALAPAGAALGGYLLGAATVSQADRGRMERSLRAELRDVTIEQLPLPFATFHHERDEQGLRLVVDRSGDLARAIGASIANPFIFEDVDVRGGGSIDPGADRVAAIPVQDACKLFPDANLLVINVAGSPAFFDKTMTCPLKEVLIAVATVPPREFLEGGHNFEHAWRTGYAGMQGALKEGRPIVAAE